MPCARLERVGSLRNSRRRWGAVLGFIWGSTSNRGEHAISHKEMWRGLYCFWCFLWPGTLCPLLSPLHLQSDFWLIGSRVWSLTPSGLGLGLIWDCPGPSLRGGSPCSPVSIILCSPSSEQRPQQYRRPRSFLFFFILGCTVWLAKS